MKKYAAFILLIMGITACDSLDYITPTYEYRDLTRDEANKIISNMPKAAEHIYIKRISNGDSSMLYVSYTVSSKSSLLEFKKSISKKVKLVQSNTLPVYWPRYNELPLSEKPFWWQNCYGTQYYYEIMFGSDRKHSDRSEGAALCINEQQSTISIWHWNIKGWGADRVKKR